MQMTDRAALAGSARDFTEAEYRRAIDLARQNYEFASFGSAPHGRHVLWRHDVDHSVHRALRLAEIEAEAGVRATYFVFPRSHFYNLLSALVLPKARRILELGHDLGLHFDPTSYGTGLTREQLESHATSERDLLAQLFGVVPVAISFHLYGVLEGLDLSDDIVAGMVNAYGRTIQSQYEYCSDSNGVWRHRRLFDVLEQAKAERLHILTHAEWWTPEAMPPRARIQRCLDGQAAALGKDYDDLTDGYGRPNIR
jgi:hypothetical protein